MAKEIEPKLKKIGNYLKLEKDAIFTIPNYQRAYSWQLYNCEKLWQDIENFIAGDSKDRYFFGTIIINCQENDTKLSLIDGQQRTTTFLLLLKALLIKINKSISESNEDEDSAPLYRGLKSCRRKIMGILYKAEDEEILDKPDLEADSIICNRIDILENNSINEIYKTELNKILQSIDYEHAELEATKIPRKQKDNKYTNFFRNFKFFYEKLSVLSESKLNTFAKTIIENCEVIEIRSWQVEQAISMFNSLNSDGLPLYDSDIISAKLYEISEKQQNKEQFNQLWQELSTLANELSLKKITNLNSLLMQRMYYERATKKETDVTMPGLRRYFTELNKDLINNPIELCEGLINLAKIWLKVADYSISKILLKFNENSKLFLASYFYRFKNEEINEKSLKTILECMLRLFAVLEIAETGYSTNKFKSFLFSENVKLSDSNISVEEIKNDFNYHISQNWNKIDIEKTLMYYDKSALVYLNEFLFSKENGIEFNLNSKCDIEHIMPSSGKNLQAIRADADINDDIEFKEIVNKLGNKILLEEDINRSIGNEWFRTKTSTKLKDKTGYIESSYPIAKSLVETYNNSEKPYWTKADILKATEKANNRIVKFIFGN